jgi:hypothetical protein
MGPFGTEASPRLQCGDRGQRPPIVLKLNLHIARLATGTAGRSGGQMDGMLDCTGESRYGVGIRWLTREGLGVTLVFVSILARTS